MRIFYFTLAALASLAPVAGAQTTGTCLRSSAEAELASDRLSARVFNGGSLFFGNSIAGEYLVEGVPVMYAANLWVGGTVNGEVRTAAATYSDFEFWPGPLGDDALPVNPNDCSDFDRIYRVSAEDIVNYEAGGGLSADLAEWPVELGAPVIDGDGIAGNYDLEGGDRPEVRGDVTAFWIMNDAGNVHAFSGSEPLGIEVRVVAFVDGVNTFYRYGVTNRSSDTIADLRVGFFADPDLGVEYQDDFVGSEPALGMGYVYNADNDDQGGFGAAPPALGVAMLSGADAVTYYINGSTALRDPQNSAEVWNALRGLRSSGEPFTIGGQGIGDGAPTQYVFPGDPASGQGWSEVSAGNLPEDRRLVVSSDPLTLEPGASRAVDLAILYGRGASNLLSVNELRETAGAVTSLYAGGGLFPALPVATDPTTPDGPSALAVRVYPNPANGTVSLAYDLPEAGAVEIAVYDVLGRVVARLAEGSRSADAHRASLDVSAWPTGVYVAEIVQEGRREVARFTVVR